MSRGETKVDADEYASLIEQGVDDRSAHVFLLVLNQLDTIHHLDASQRAEYKQQALTIASREAREPVNVLRGMFGNAESGHG